MESILNFLMASHMDSVMRQWYTVPRSCPGFTLPFSEATLRRSYSLFTTSGVTNALATLYSTVPPSALALAFIDLRSLLACANVELMTFAHTVLP